MVITIRKTRSEFHAVQIQQMPYMRIQLHYYNYRREREGQRKQKEYIRVCMFLELSSLKFIEMCLKLCHDFKMNVK